MWVICRGLPSRGWYLLDNAQIVLVAGMVASIPILVEPWREFFVSRPTFGLLAPRDPRDPPPSRAFWGVA